MAHHHQEFSGVPPLPGNVTSASNDSVDILVLGSQRTQRITGSAFRISFQPDWQIDNGFFQQANRKAYSNPGTQMGAWSKDFKGLKGTQSADAHVHLISFLN